MYYIEFYDRRPHVALDEFHRVTLSAFPEWERRYPDDELVANLGRTWRLGRDPYILIWGIRSFAQWDEWDRVFHSDVADDLEVPLLEVMTTYQSGFYQDLGAPLPRPAGGPFYVELFEPQATSERAYQARAQGAGVQLSLLLRRIGLLGPDPGGIAIISLTTMSDIERLVESTPEWVVSVGAYDLVGQEIL
jgi:hypothetical protein